MLLPRLGKIDFPQLLNDRSSVQTGLKYAANQTICEQGDTAEALFYIEEGLVAVSVATVTGKEAVVGLRTAGDFVGLQSILGGE